MAGTSDGNSGREFTVESAPPPGDATQYDFLDPPLEPDELGRVGDYRVKRVLGSGGMGIVFEALDPVLQRKVALKFLRPELASHAANRERFLREAQAAVAAGIHSDYIVSVLHVGMAKNVPFIATQFLIGESLQERLDRTKRVELRPALVIVRDVALGLAAAHAIGLVHRDIKPANIWLESDRPGGSFRRVKILDFGLARHTHSNTSLTASGVIIGTPDFMSPEQVDGVAVDHRADLFSLGAVLYTMLSGEEPFKGRSAMAVLMAVASRSVPPIATKVPEVPGAVGTLLSSMLEKDPARRPASAMQIVDVLDSVLSGLAPTTPVPPLPLSQRETPAPSNQLTVADVTSFRRMSRRNLLRGLGGAAVIGAAGLGAALYLRRNEPSGVATEPIKVGVLYSTSGPMASSEIPLLDATILAIEDVNRSGGVRGRTIVPVRADGQSDSNEFAKAARKLLMEDKVSAIFGCWLSSALRGVSKEVERNDGLLFFPMHYEGLSQSPRVVNMGLTANQFLLPVLNLLTGTRGRKRLFLIGGSDVYSYAAHEMIRDWVAQRPGVSVVGDIYLPFGTKKLDDTIAAIQKSKADSIVNTIDGSTNFELFARLRAAGLTSENCPVFSTSLTETELRGVGYENLAGHFVAASYFQSVDRPVGRAFREAFRTKYGTDRLVSDLMGSAYYSVKLWAKAVEKAESFEPEAVATALKGLEIEGVSGLLRVDPETMHLWRPWRIGQVLREGGVKVVAESGESVRPIPFPDTRSREKWNEFLEGLFNKWGGWEDPAKF